MVGIEPEHVAGVFHAPSESLSLSFPWVARHPLFTRSPVHLRGHMIPLQPDFALRGPAGANFFEDEGLWQHPFQQLHRGLLDFVHDVDGVPIGKLDKGHPHWHNSEAVALEPAGGAPSIEDIFEKLLFGEPSPHSFEELFSNLPALDQLRGPEGGSGWSVSESTTKVNGHQLPSVVRVHFFGPKNETIHLTQQPSSTNSTFDLDSNPRSVALLHHDHGSPVGSAASPHASEHHENSEHSKELTSSLTSEQRRRQRRKGTLGTVVANVPLPFAIDTSNPVDVKSHPDGSCCL